MCVSHLGRYTQSRRSFQGVFLLRGGWGGLVAGHAAAPTCRLLRRFQVLIYVLQPDCSDQTDCSRFSSRLFGLFKNDVLLLPETEEADQSADSISAVNQQCVCVCVCVCAAGQGEDVFLSGCQARVSWRFTRLPSVLPRHLTCCK